MTPERKASLKKYRESAKGKAAYKKWRQSPHGKEAWREYMQRYSSSPKGKASRRKYTYGLSASDHEALLKSQNGACAICLKTPEQLDGRDLFVDHDHVTGRVRGLLCNDCNLGIGRLGDDPLRVMSAFKYLTRAS